MLTSSEALHHSNNIAQVVTYFQKCRIKDDLIPHIYSIAQSALISLYSRKSTETLADKRRKKQAIITMGGVEGENSQILKNSLEYLVTSREPFTSLAQDGAFTPLSNDQSLLLSSCFIGFLNNWFILF